MPSLRRREGRKVHRATGTRIWPDKRMSAGVVVPSARLFYLGDANYNVTALVNTSGQVVERYAYTPYGQVTYYHGNDQPGTYADWSPAGTSSAYGNTRLFAGMHFNPATGLYDDRARPYDPALERFIGRDPAVADENLYRYCAGDPATFVDPSGGIKVTNGGPFYGRGDREPTADTANNIGAHYHFSDWYSTDPAGMVQTITDNGTFFFSADGVGGTVSWTESYNEAWSAAPMQKSITSPIFTMRVRLGQPKQSRHFWRNEFSPRSE